jgi:magnesium chelatase family protein
VSRNADIPGVRLRREFPPAGDGAELLAAAERHGLSPRGVDRVLRVSWTVADLGGRDRPGRDDVALALALREPAGSVA